MTNFPATSSSTRGIVSRFSYWLLGRGFLSLHATLFALASVLLVGWNLVTEPGDIWADEILMRWGFLLVVHAIIVFGLIAVRRLLQVGQEPVVTPVAPSWTSPASSTAETVQPESAGVEVAEAWARKWLVAQGAIAGPSTEPSVADVSFSVVRLDGNTGVQRSDPAASWPLTKPVVMPPVDELAIEVATMPILSGVDPHRTRITADLLATETVNAAGESEWRWVEAAANAWLARRQEEAAGVSHVTPREPAGRPAGRPAQDAS